MSAAEAAVLAPVEDPAELPEDTRDALRDLLLVLADSKRLLGMRYSDWMLGAPMLEAGIAASSMAQDEWGHGRLTYALLGAFGDEPQALEHEREADAYRGIQPLDRSPGSWSEMIAYALLLDTALATQYRALLDSRYAPVHNRVQKLLDEEAFHFPVRRRLDQADRANGDHARGATGSGERPAPRGAALVRPGRLSRQPTPGGRRNRDPRTRGAAPGVCGRAWSRCSRTPGSGPIGMRRRTGAAGTTPPVAPAAPAPTRTPSPGCAATRTARCCWTDDRSGAEPGAPARSRRAGASRIRPLPVLRRHGHRAGQPLWRPAFRSPVLVPPLPDGLRIHQVRRFGRRILSADTSDAATLGVLFRRAGVRMRGG